MKKFWLQVVVILILVVTFVAFPLLVYPPIPPATKLTAVARSSTDKMMTKDSHLTWFKHPTKERFYGVPKQTYPEFNQDKTPYFIETPANVDFYNAGNHYLITPQSEFGRFLFAHQAELNATKVNVIHSSSSRKYQIMGTLTPALEVSKQSGNPQITLSHLSPTDYEALLQQKAHDPKLSNMIVQQDPIQHSVNIDPTIHKADLKIWLCNAWVYLKSSLHLDNIVKPSYADTSHH